MNLLLSVAALLIGQRDPDWRPDPDQYVQVGVKPQMGPPKPPKPPKVYVPPEILDIPLPIAPELPVVEVPVKKMPVLVETAKPPRIEEPKPPLPKAMPRPELLPMPNTTPQRPKGTAKPSPWPFRPPSEQEAIKALWPDLVPFPLGLEFYYGTRYAQRTAVTDFPQAGIYNELTHEWERASGGNIVGKYARPGGLLLSDRASYRSFTGVVLGRPINTGLVTFSFAGAYGGYLRQKSWAYAEGTVFVNLLVRETGEPFMVRMLEALPKGQWEPFVAFRDKSKFPPGFEPVKLRHCVGCHKDAGSAAYGQGIRGGGGIFSYPVQELGLFK